MIENTGDRVRETGWAVGRLSDRLNLLGRMIRAISEAPSSGHLKSLAAICEAEADQIGSDLREAAAKFLAALDDDPEGVAP